MAQDNLLRVQKICAVKLFGRYNHDVDLKSTDRITIIHGPNGVGKTVLLRLTDALLSGHLTTVIKVPFLEFFVTLSDGTVLGFRRGGEIMSRSEEKGLMGILYLKRDGHELARTELKATDQDVVRNAAYLERQLGWLSRIEKDKFQDHRTDEVISALEVISRYSEFFPGGRKRNAFLAEPEWLSEIRQKVGVHLIETQRLLRFSRLRHDWQYNPGSAQTYTATVRDYAVDLQKRISDTLKDYATESQSLDQSFPQRMIRSDVRTLPVDELISKMQALEEKRNQLKLIRLIDDDPTYPFDITTLEELDETKRTVMSLYVEDTERKLGTLDDLANRIQVLLGTINKKFKDKSITVDRERGILATTANHESLDLDALSSGEQHELVLLYDLLFRVKANTLVLIDEPELSLHVTWQKSFLPDLLNIVRTTGFDVLLATHSPFIAGDRSDLMVALEPQDRT